MKVSYGFNDFKSPVERILEIFVNLKDLLKDENMNKELDWCMEIIS